MAGAEAEGRWESEAEAEDEWASEAEGVPLTDLDNVAANTHNDDLVLITNKSDLKLPSTDCQFGEIAMIFELLKEVPDSSYCQFQRYFHS